MKKLLAIPGSLRDTSSSFKILYLVRDMLPADIEFEIYTGIGNLPHFNDPVETPAGVIDFKGKLREADGIIICTPEYAFGVPGSLKNALDWTVGTGELDQKPVALITASSVGDKGHAALLHILTALSVRFPEDGSLLIPFIRAKLNPEGKLMDAEALRGLKKLVASITSMING